MSKKQMLPPPAQPEPVAEPVGVLTPEPVKPRFLLLRERILGNESKLARQPIEQVTALTGLFPDFTGDNAICVRVLPPAEKFALDGVLSTAAWEVKNGKFFAAAIVACACDIDGNPIFSSEHLTAIEHTIDRRFTEPIWDKALELNDYFIRQLKTTVKN